MATPTFFSLIADELLMVSAVVFFGWLAMQHKRKRSDPTSECLMRRLNLSIKSLCENLILFGATGSGKTTILLKLLREIVGDVGICFLTVKPDAPDDYLKICEGHDHYLFVCGETLFNPVDYILSAKWGSPVVLADFLEQADNLQSRQSGDKEGGYWKLARRETIVHTAGICHIAYKGHVTFEHLYKVLNTIPSNPETVRLDNTAWTQSFCHETLVRATLNVASEEEARLVRAAHDYLTVSAPGAGQKALMATVQHVAALIANFTRGPMYRTTCCEQYDDLVAYVLNGGKLIFADPVLQGMQFQFLQLMFSQILTKAALSRSIHENTPVTLLVADEYHLVSTPQDADSCTQGRSQLYGRITAVQSVSTLLNAMNEGFKAKHQAMTLIGNHNTKIFLNSGGDPETGELFEKLVGKEMKAMAGGSRNPNPQKSGFDPLGVGSEFSLNWHSSLLPRKLASALTRLKTGGDKHGRIVTGYVHQGGTDFGNGQSFKKFQVEQ